MDRGARTRARRNEMYVDGLDLALVGGMMRAARSQPE
jgi:hypothetical protein